MIDLIEFAGGDAGPWRVTRAESPLGERLPSATRLSVSLPIGNMGQRTGPSTGTIWRLRGVVSNLRYTTSNEAQRLRAVQPPLDRPSATRAALIPIRKSARVWELSHDDRRAICE